MIVINLTSNNIAVGVIHDTTKVPDFVTIVSKGTVVLREGLSVCPRWLAVNSNAIMIKDDTK